MELKKIEVQGFKSFADKTEIQFLEGITTIVGPNGSGKSNISDAVRWVLGEQSIKNLRGAKMEDVIFAGTEARKKVGFAEVSMYLDNSDGELPVEYKEVVVTRRVYRTGESNYLLNDSECRLKDIQELFMDTGVGRDGYSIISQGKIDEILSSKSEERRHIFEEASGIVKYRTRKDEATKKLDNTQVTLSRVADILNEIENIIGPLEKKAETAKKYLTLRDELKILDVRLFLDSINKNADSLRKLDDIIETFSNDILKEEKSNEDLECLKVDIKERLQDITLKIETTQAKFFDISSEIERLNSKIDISTASIENSKLNIDRLNNEIIEDNNKILLLNDDIEKRIIKKKSMEENKLKFQNELDLKQEELNEMIKTLDSKGIEIEELKQKIESDNENRYELKVDSSSMSATIESNEKQISEKEKIFDKNIYQKDSINAQKEDILLELEKKSNELKSASEKVLELTSRSNEYNFQVENIREEENKLKKDIMTLESKYNYLLNLEKENEGYYKSVKSALEYAKTSNIKNVYGTVASLISTDEKYEYAIEIALGGYLQNVVVENENEAKQIISYLKENTLGRVTFLPISSIKKVSFDVKGKISKLKGYVGMATELVKFDKKYADAINLSLGGIAIVDNIDNAVEISKSLKNSVKIVTLAGELISSTGSITGGQVAHKSAGLIGRIEKIAELKNQIKEEQEKCDNLTAQISKIFEESNVVVKELETLKEKQDELKIEVATFSEKYENIKIELEKLESTKATNMKAIEELKDQNHELQLKLVENDEEVSRITIQIEKSQNIIDEYTRFNKEKQQAIDFLNEDVVNLKISLSSFDESVSSIDEMKEKFELDIQNFELAISKKKEQIENLNKSIEDNNVQIESIKEKINSQVKFKEEYTDITEKLKSEKDSLTKKQEEIEVDMTKTFRKIESLKEEKAKVEAKKVKFDIDIENLKNKMWDDYELTVSSSKKLVETLPESEISENEIKNKAEKIRKQIKDLGEVSISAIEEYNNTKERYDFISTQKIDLEETKTKLEGLINNMTVIMKQQFTKQFKIITENFNETFKELFGGGKADLKLSDENDVLASGIEIEVQPPGKKLQSMSLLSGGERALTATALLFAILKIKSPPFCILDEIEAALDDVNVHRFAEYIKKYSKNTQFIVITHRKGTMEVASSVYGVTMQEYGISKIISMKLK